MYLHHHLTIKFKDCKAQGLTCRVHETLLTCNLQDERMNSIHKRIYNMLLDDALESNTVDYQLLCNSDGMYREE